MAEYGFAEPAEGGSYRAGPRLLGLAAAALHDGRDLQLARPALADLRRRTGQLAYYAVRHLDDAIYLELSEPAREYRMSMRPGARTPLHLSGVGLAMLSALPSHETDAVLDGAPLTARTPHSLTDPAALRALLLESAQRGYAVEDEYNEPDIRSVAAPVLDGGRDVVGAIGLTGPTFTLDPASVELVGPMVRAAAGTISAGLGGPRPSFDVVGFASFRARGAALGGEPA